MSSSVREQCEQRRRKYLEQLKRDVSKLSGEDKFDTSIVHEATYEDITRLNGSGASGWLTSDVIDEVLSRLMMKSPDHIIALSSYFSQGLLGNDTTTRRLEDIPLYISGDRKVVVSTKSKILIPMNVGNVHWCLVVVDIPRFEVCFYDSLGESTDDVEPLYSRLIYFLSRRILVETGFNVQNYWTHCHPSEKIPVQKNGRDCGVFVLMFAEHIIGGGIIEKMKVTSGDVLYARCRFVCLIFETERQRVKEKQFPNPLDVRVLPRTPCASPLPYVD